MTWINDNKGEGPWPLEEQPDKPFYNEGNLISNHSNPVWETNFTGVPITSIHYPGCGYWHKELAPCIPDPNLMWDSDISATTIGQSDSVIVAVIGLNCPFVWSVVGSGFSLKHSMTKTSSNTLLADATACGAAIITVVGCDGVVVTGYVKGLIGQWTNDFSIAAPDDIPQPEGWYWPARCRDYCGAGGVDYGSWGVFAPHYGYFTSIHRSARYPQTRGYCYSEGCVDFASQINTFDDGYTVTTEELIIKDTGLSKCPRGCIGTRYNSGIGAIYGQRWVC